MKIANFFRSICVCSFLIIPTLPPVDHFDRLWVQEEITLILKVPSQRKLLSEDSWSTLRGMIGDKQCFLGHNSYIRHFLRKHQTNPCTERFILDLAPINGDYINGSRRRLVGILIKIFEDEKALKNSRILNQKLKLPYWEKGVIGIIEIENHPFLNIYRILSAFVRDLNGNILNLSLEPFTLSDHPLPKK